MRTLIVAAFAALSIHAAQAQEVGISANDTTQSVLAAQKGKRVTVRLMSGQEMTGTVREATTKLVVLASVSGRELFDAVIPLEAIEAVLIRNK
jgi:hypothetical protein